jgi:hypothetical protein
MMGLILKGAGDFKPAPTGLHLGVCVDVVDKGDVETSYGTKPMVVLVWEIDKLMEDGKRFTVRRMYHATLHPKSSLHKDLADWRGRAFTSQELKSFDSDKLIGAACQLLVKHTERDGQVWADVSAIMKCQNGQRLAPSGNYVRVKDRESEKDEKDAFGRQAGDDGYGNHDFDEDPPDDPMTLPGPDESGGIPF